MPASWLDQPLVRLAEARLPGLGPVLHCVVAGRELPLVVGAALWAVAAGPPEEVAARLYGDRLQALLDWPDGVTAELLSGGPDQLVVRCAGGELELRGPVLSGAASALWVSDGTGTERIGPAGDDGAGPAEGGSRRRDGVDLDAVVAAVQEAARRGGATG